jgi:mRNA interferase MazF
VKRGDIWLVTLDPTVGTEIQKTRPCVIVSPDELNGILRRVIVAPMTGGSHPASFRVPTTFKGKTGLILLDQIRTVDRRRCIKRVGGADQATLNAALDVLASLFGR